MNKTAIERSFYLLRKAKNDFVEPDDFKPIL